MNRKDLQAWLDKYVQAWRTYEPEQIRELFSEDALYFYSPWDEDRPLRGREAIVADWLKAPDKAGSWEAHYVPVAVEDNVAVAQGRTVYRNPDGSFGRQFDNIFVIHFDEAGRCTRFTEWFMQPRSSE
jgi:SnoaL-like domain